MHEKKQAFGLVLAAPLPTKGRVAKNRSVTIMNGLPKDTGAGRQASSNEGSSRKDSFTETVLRRCWFLQMVREKPLVKLALVMTFNGLLSLACAAAIIKIEHPQQQVRSHIILCASSVSK